MKYSARLVTALAVIAFVAVALVTAIVKVTAPAAATVTRGVLTIGETITVRLGGHEGGMQRFVHRTQAILLVPYRFVEPFFDTMATNAFFGLRPGHGTFVGTMTLTTRTNDGHIVQHRYQATATTHGYRDDDDGTKGTTRRWLQWTIPFFGARHIQRVA